MKFAASLAAYCLLHVFTLAPTVALAQEASACGTGSSAVEFGFEKRSATHARALSSLGGLVTRTAKVACREAELPVLARILRSEHSISAVREICPAAPCNVTDEGETVCPPCSPAGYLASGSAIACCAERRSR